MATTTTNFGWDIPQSTDLVKDGATAIAALGQDIDTAMVDLKGGTTGQVLAKASATDLDFSWVAQDDSNAIQNAIVDAKGDLIGATAADTPARLAVGTNGQMLTADSTAATGLAWTTPSSGGMTVIGTGTLSGSSVVVSSIPSTYKHLQVVIYGATWDTSNDTPQLRYNSVTTNYTLSTYGFTQTLASNTGGVTASGWNNNEGGSNWLRSGGKNAASWTIYNYTKTTGLIDAVGSCSFENTNPTYSRSVSQFSNQATATAITSVTIRLGGGQNMTAGTYIVYGVS